MNNIFKENQTIINRGTTVSKPGNLSTIFFPSGDILLSNISIGSREIGNTTQKNPTYELTYPNYTRDGLVNSICVSTIKVNAIVNTLSPTLSMYLMNKYPNLINNKNIELN